MEIGICALVVVGAGVALLVIIADDIAKKLGRIADSLEKNCSECQDLVPGAMEFEANGNSESN